MKKTLFVFVFMNLVMLSQIFGQYSNKIVVITSSLSNVNVIVDGEVVGKTPFRKTFFTDSDTLYLQVGKEGYLTNDYILDFSKRNEHKIHVKLIKGPKTKTAAVISSAIIPGSGQIYSGRYLAGVALAGVTLGALIGSKITHQSYVSAKNEYLYAKQQYDENIYPGSFSDLYSDMQSAYSTMENKYTKRNIFFSLTAVLWVYNIVDCYIHFPKVKNIYLSFYPNPDYSRISLNIKIYAYCLSSEKDRLFSKEILHRLDFSVPLPYSLPLPVGEGFGLGYKKYGKIISMKMNSICIISTLH